MKSKILPIGGDASFRQFYRFISNKESRIIVFTEKEKYKNLIAYSAINKFLRKNKILCPKLFGYNIKKGIIIIEDFGNLSFHRILSNQKNKMVIYKKLVDLLLKIQKIKPKRKIESIISKPHPINKYSSKYLHKESDLFFEWYLPFFFKRKNIYNIKKKMKKILSKLYNNLNYGNTFFVHRDYHSQNLMKVGKKVGLIDSQDALIGNHAYDLVSLIDDVRIKTSKKIKIKIYNYYLKKRSKIYKLDQQKFLDDFHILSVQRSLKIIGIFSRLYKRDKKNVYLKLIPYTWKLLEMRMNLKIFSELKGILDKNIPKKIRRKIILS